MLLYNKDGTHLNKEVFMKKIRWIGLVLLVFLVGTIFVFADKKPSEEPDYSQPIKVVVKNKISDPDKEFKFIASDNREIPFISNKLNDKTYVLAPLVSEKGMSLKRVNPGNVVSITAYTGEIFVQNMENLKKIQKMVPQFRAMYNYVEESASPRDSATKSAPPGAAGESGSIDQSKSSETNVQVKGVDEADVVKVVGDRIYYLSPSKLYIAKVDQGKIVEAGKIEANIKYGPFEMYADGDRVVLIGSEYRNHKEYTVTMVYDVKDAKNPKLYRTLAQEGSYSSSRKVGKQIYLVSTTYLYDKVSIADGEIKSTSLDLATLRCFPPYITDSITTVSSFAIDNKEATVHNNFIGEAHDIYMNDKSLYVSYTEYHRGGWIPRPVPFEGGQLRSAGLSTNSLDETINITPEDAFLDKTIIKKFSINKGKVSYVGEAKINGTLINQFAMDESDGYFRVAHTRDFDSGSEVSVFDKNMKPVGNLKAIAPGEKIYSARFMGEKLYLVTFKQVDPFFVIDLKNPKSPKILGYLKIPGYSDYLHPYDENHIIGFGRDTKVRDYGATINMGMKIAMFDVTDVKNPKQISNVSIGDHGTYSELLQNHKALMYNAEKNYFGFPISISKQREGKEYWYTDTVFEGGYVYEITKDFKIKFKGQTEHRNPGQKNDDRYQIDRLVYVGDYIYSISWSQISSNRASDMKEIQKISWSW